MSAVRFFLTLFLLSALLIFCLDWIIYWKLYGKKQSIREKNRQEAEKKLLTHIKNFSPIRLKNRTWQKSIGKNKKTAKSRKIS